MTYQLIHGDCLDVDWPQVDAIITDVPYETTGNSWDVIIPFPVMWTKAEKALQNKGAFITTASQPFTSALIISNVKNFNCEWIWNKKLAGNGIQAKRKPLKIHENIVVFYGEYKPQKTKGKARWKGGIKDNHGTFGGAKSDKVWSDEYYPVSIIEYSGAGMRSTRVHPTQKPVALYEYLIKTYTNEGDTVLDFCFGSCTTGEACINTGRNFIGIEKELKYFEIGKERMRLAQDAHCKN